MDIKDEALQTQFNYRKSLIVPGGPSTPPTALRKEKSKIRMGKFFDPSQWTNLPAEVSSLLVCFVVQFAVSFPLFSFCLGLSESECSSQNFAGNFHCCVGHEILELITGKIREQSKAKVKVNCSVYHLQKISVLIRNEILNPEIHEGCVTRCVPEHVNVHCCYSAYPDSNLTPWVHDACAVNPASSLIDTKPREKYVALRSKND